MNERDLYLMQQKLNDIEINNRKIIRLLEFVNDNNRKILKLLENVKVLEKVKYVDYSNDDSGIWKGPSTWD